MHIITGEGHELEKPVAVIILAKKNE